MDFQFDERSKLYGRILHLPIDRYHYVPSSETGETEHVFCYRDGVPTEKEEPDLFRDAQKEVETAQIILRYQTLESEKINEMVLLTTLEADDTFIREHPDLVGNQMFTIDSGKDMSKNEGAKQY